MLIRQGDVDDLYPPEEPDDSIIDEVEELEEAIEVIAPVDWCRDCGELWSDCECGQ